MFIKILTGHSVNFKVDSIMGGETLPLYAI